MPIELQQVGYTYMPGTPFERKALHDITVTIAEGSFVAIAGHTGSGKSTLLQHFNGLLHPTEGRVLVDGIDLAVKTKEEKHIARDARRKVGMVFQYAEQQLFEETVEKDIAFGARNYGCSEVEITERVRQAMHDVHLDFNTYRERSPFELSGGQMRRVAIAGVLALHPKYLVLDEPVAGLDPRGREELIHMLGDIHKKGVTVLFVSHNMDDIARLADTVFVMQGGRLVLQGTPHDVFLHNDKLIEAGLRPPQVVQVLEKLHAKGIPIRTDILDEKAAVQHIAEVLQAK